MTLEERLSLRMAESIDSLNHPVGVRGKESAKLSLVPEFAVSMNESQQRLSLLQAFVKDVMVAGVDYGIVPGCTKPSLLKPGAEKLIDVFGLSKQIEVLNRQEDWSQGFFSYEVLVSLINKSSNMVEAQGVGSCNSREKRYKKQDAFSLANTLLKMAEKRALIDAALSASRTSFLFTQDMDVAVEIESQTRHQPEFQNQPRMATEKQRQKIYSLATGLKLLHQDVRDLMKDRYDTESTKQLTISQASDLIKYLQQFVI